ncbi:heme exporter protein CcmD [Kordiimonas sp. SCSIO 12603]|nr:heme exporter protein CcmD [Kordiimonas sp. SCSIO 12603]UTW59239.1 heme exporter protein CcmD [Kordiimonas sp. SCSIO 12603]
MAGDYSFYIAVTYGISAVALLLLAGLSYRRMKASNAKVAELRSRRRKR